MNKAQKLAMERHELAVLLSSIQGRLVAAGLPITARAHHSAVRAIGWELAGDTKKAAEYAK